ncbi:DUF445 domain-containing protein [Halalkalibacillus sediminis]|uniref:DUF445 domain-containing protein n=1 Tax=Halalkalibacillus sediminis TaxID=2018042 RepID=A0A2I0QV85_9BACI|nr:DUF445 family protein [Halalkalibacillus sediminis]PKR78261.1 DUF445 domain-containing protein [Halalkalibacillus sediminis]
MNLGFLLLMMVGIGALIGGMTNYLAIKMLFRPYNPIYIGKWKVPFTPGLIPKRQDELARQLGDLVVNHLITANALEEKLNSKELQGNVSSFINKQLEDQLKSKRTVLDVLSTINSSVNEKVVKNKVESFIQIEIHSWIQENKDKPLEQVLPEDFLQKIEKNIPQASDYIVNQLSQFLSSEEGRAKLSQAASEFLETQGFLGNMVSSYLGEEGLVDKLVPPIQQFLQSGDTHETVSKMLEDEWSKWKKKDLTTFFDSLGIEEIDHRAANYLVNHLKIENYLHQPVSDWLRPYHQMIQTELVPRVVGGFLSQLSRHMDWLFETMDLSEMVKEQVEAFDVARLEKMVLEITKREFNMITYLGALLGGMIGLIQGIIVWMMT